MRYVVYEVWTRARIIEAENDETAYRIAEPKSVPHPKLNLCNWHIVPISDNSVEPEEEEREDFKSWLAEHVDLGHEVKVENIEERFAKCSCGKRFLIIKSIPKSKMKLEEFR